MNKKPQKTFSTILTEACRLRAPQLINENNEINQNKAAIFFGIPQPTFFRWLRVGSFPKDENIRKLAEKIKLSPAQLRGEEPLPSGSEKTQIGAQFNGVAEMVASYRHQTTTELTKVPVISLVAAGQWNEAEKINPTETKEWRITTAEVSQKAFAIRIEGDSMTNPYGTPSIPHGSIVLVDPERQAENGKIVIAKFADSDDAVVKKLVIDGPNKYLKPLNPDYKIIKIDENCKIIGVAVQMVVDF